MPGALPRDMRSVLGRSGGVSVTGILPAVERATRVGTGRATGRPEPDPAPVLVPWVRETFSLDLAGTASGDEASMPEPWPVGVWVVSATFYGFSAGTGDRAAVIETGLRVADGGSNVAWTRNPVALTDDGTLQFTQTTSTVLNPGDFYHPVEQTFAVYATTDGVGNSVDMLPMSVNGEVTAVRIGDGA